MLATSAPQLPSVSVLEADVATCSLCGGHADLAFTATDRNRAISTQPFRYRRCDVCRCYTLVDVPEDLGPFYPADYYGLRGVAELEQRAYIDAHKVARVRAHVPTGRLVEVGPAGGTFAHAARRAGYHVTAIERDERISRHLNDVINIPTINSADPVRALEGLPPTDVVAMWHVIEHLPNPWEVLNAAADLLRPGGALVLSAPNPDSLQCRLLKARWAHVDAPRHLVLLPLRELTKRCAAVGLRLTELTTSDPAGRHINWMGWEYAVRRRPAAGPAPRPLALATLGFTLAMRPIEHTGERGAAYTAVFTKV